MTNGAVESFYLRMSYEVFFFFVFENMSVMGISIGKIKG